MAVQRRAVSLLTMGLLKSGLVIVHREASQTLPASMYISTVYRACPLGTASSVPLESTVRDRTALVFKSNTQ